MGKTSPTRDNILAFIQEFKTGKDYAPTVREIAEHCAIKSTSVVQYHLDKLEEAGLITRAKKNFRSISLPAAETRQLVEVPILGTISAGRPIWVPSADRWSGITERTVEVSPVVTKGKKNIFALEVKGNSMVDAMIADSDIVIIEQTPDIKNGDVAACWLKNEQEVTLKKIYYENERIRLQPCNPYMMPLYYDASNVEPQGKVIAVIRIV
ncbi:MAG TPA: transcriptional repressor LexA [Syntrophorhabdaceae bacterium]|jgi:repressor LexA